MRKERQLKLESEPNIYENHKSSMNYPYRNKIENFIDFENYFNNLFNYIILESIAK